VAWTILPPLNKDEEQRQGIALAFDRSRALSPNASLRDARGVALAETASQLRGGVRAIRAVTI
jgi:hypothetical protein